MASQGVSIRIDVDPNGVVTGVNTIDQALDKMEKSLDSASKSGDKDLASLEKGLQDVKAEARDTGAVLSRSIDHGTRAGTDGSEVHFGSFKKNAKAAAKTVSEAFDGSAESIVGAAQVAGTQLFSTLPGVASAAAVAGLGLAIGAVSAIISEQTKFTEESKARVKALADQLIELGDIDVSQVADNVQAIVTSTKDGVPSMEDLRKKSEETGVAIESIVLAYAGNKEAVKGLQAAIQKKYETERAAWIAANGASADSLAQFTAQEEKLISLGQDVNKLADEYAQAQEIEKYYNETGIAGLVAHQEAVQSFKDSVNTAYDTAAAAAGKFQDAQTGAIDVQGYIDWLATVEGVLTSYQSRLAEAALPDATKDFIASQGSEAGSQMMEAWAQATDEQKGVLKEKWAKAAEDASLVANDKIEGILGKEPVVKEVDIKINKENIDKELDEITSPRKVKVYVDWRDRLGNPIY